MSTTSLFVKRCNCVVELRLTCGGQAATLVALSLAYAEKLKGLPGSRCLFNGAKHAGDGRLQNLGDLKILKC